MSGCGRLSPSILVLVLSFGLPACPSDKRSDDTGPGVQGDRDGDGVPDKDDCAPEDSSVYPGATDGCDGKDQDCDGEIDEDPDFSWYLDLDGDGFGAPGDPQGPSCEAIEGRVHNALDCDDSDRLVFPGAGELCNGRDDDCDALIDESVAVQVDVAAGEGGDGSPERPYSSIQEGIDSGSSCVSIARGTYRERIEIDRGYLHLLGKGGSTVTFLEGDASSSVMIVRGAMEEVLIEGLTVSGGADLYGGGVYVEEASVELRDVVLRDNEAEWAGGALAVFRSPSVLLVDLLVDGNGADRGGGIYLQDSELRAEGLSLYGNAALGEGAEYLSGFGGGILAYASRLEIENGEIRENLGYLGGALAALNKSSLDLQGVVVQDNFTSRWGYAAGAYLESSDLRGTGLWVLDNLSNGNAGFYAYASTVNLENALFAGNRGLREYLPYSGGMEISYYSSVRLVNTTFADLEGTAALVVWDYASIELLNSIVASNRGYGLYLASATSSFGISYSDLWGNVEGDLTGMLSELPSDQGNLSEDPLFVEFSDNLDASDDDYVLSAGSPAVDAGDPSDKYMDQDGSRNDMGFTGGPSAGITK